MERLPIRSATIAAVAVLAVVLLAGPAAAEPADGDQSVANGTVAPGETTTLTVTTTMDESGGRLSVSGEYSGAIESVSVEGVTVDGQMTIPALSQSSADGSIVTFSETQTGPNATVEVVYAVTAADTEGEITLNTSVTGGNASFALDPATVTVSEAPLTASQSVQSTEVAPGDSTALNVSVVNPSNRLTVRQSFDPAVENTSVASVTVDGESVSPTVATTSANLTVITLSNLSVNDTVSVRIDFSVPSAATDGSTVTVDGNATSGDQAVDFETQTVSVVESDPVRRFDSEGDGIGIGDLGNAASVFASGELSINELGAVAQAYASGG